MKKLSALLLVTILLITTGCSNTGTFLANNTTMVELSEGNYEIVAKNITGSATSSYLIGGSFSIGVKTDSFGLIKLEGTRTLYKDAREDFWNTYEAEHGPVEGKKLALVNVQFDNVSRNFILYTYTRITMTADVIEFE